MILVIVAMNMIKIQAGVVCMILLIFHHLNNVAFVVEVPKKMNLMRMVNV